MPPDYLDRMTCLEARVGRANIRRYDKIIDNRRSAARTYFDHLPNSRNFRLPPRVDGATYSHFVVRVRDRDRWLQAGIQNGIQLGWLIEYSIPEMKSYGALAADAFPVAGNYARTCINLPVWGGQALARKVCTSLNRWKVFTRLSKK
jgi:dTDP-4-amino-4,6-dideoxygalactose transaminase